MGVMWRSALHLTPATRSSWIRVSDGARRAKLRDGPMSHMVCQRNTHFCPRSACSSLAQIRASFGPVRLPRPRGFREMSTSSESNYYDILGVSKTATEKEIKSAYRKQALKWHPDRHQGKKEKEDASAMFTRITDAYQTLSDPAKRSQYDNSLRFGGGANSQQFGGQQGFGGHPFMRQPTPEELRQAEQMFREFFRGQDIGRMFEQQFGRGFADFESILRQQPGRGAGSGVQQIVEQSILQDSRGRTIQRTVTTTITPDGRRTVQTQDRVLDEGPGTRQTYSSGNTHQTSNPFEEFMRQQHQQQFDQAQRAGPQYQYGVGSGSNQSQEPTFVQRMLARGVGFLMQRALRSMLESQSRAMGHQVPQRTGLISGAIQELVKTVKRGLRKLLQR